jgi:hypothetical protein
MFKTIVDNGFFKTSIFIIKCTPFLLKISEDLHFKLMIIKAKMFEIVEIHFKTQFDHICFKNVFNFENVLLTKVIHFYVIQNMNAYYKLYRLRWSKKIILIT